MRQHAFGVGVGGDDEVVQLPCGFVWGVGFEVVVQGFLGGFVELFGVEGFMRGSWIGLRGGLGVGLIIGELPFK
ncbi:hypothetical protein [Pseudomonas halotolerans]|uniref:hypothetical protein n=1 Tax=Pseudomonas halotolerans TaxID=3143552 RepID=UPI0031E2B984